MRRASYCWQPCGHSVFVLEIDGQIPLRGLWRCRAKEIKGKERKGKGGKGRGNTGGDKKLNGAVEAIKANTSAA